MDRNGATTYQSTTVTSYNDTVNQQSYASGDGYPPPAETPVRSTRVIAVDPYFDIHYFKTASGILKIIELICTLIAFIISVATWSSHYFYEPNTRTYRYYPYAYGSAVWTDIVTAIAFLLTLVFLMMYLFHVIEKLYEVPWLLTETLYCLTVAFCLLIAGAVMIPSYGDPARGACVFFCWAAFVAYVVEAGLKIRALRRNEPAQGV